MTAPRYRRSSVRAVLEKSTQDHAVAAQAHDALWAVLWNRRYEDVDEPVFAQDASYWGVVVFTRTFDPDTTLTALDTGEALLVVRTGAEPPPIGSRVRVMPGPLSGPEQWRFADVTSLGLGIELRFDEHAAGANSAWIEPLRGGVTRLRELLDARRERLAMRRAQLGALNEPPSVEDVWREEVSAISDRVALETEYTAAEHAAIARARAKGARSADEEERRIIAARKRRFAERGNEEVARFRDDRWPAIRDAAAAEARKYAEYRTEVVRLEDALQRIRGFAERAGRALRMLDQLERNGFRVRSVAFAPERLEDAAYADELLRTIELLHAAIPQRAHTDAASFSAYRAPTAGPSVSPPRF